MDYGLAGRTVLITGGSRGIGKAAAVRFAAESAYVYVTYSSNRELANRTAEDIRRSGGSCEALRLVLGDERSVRDAFDRIERERGGLDVLVNNAVRWGEEAPIDEGSGEAWSDVLDRTVTGTYKVTRAAVPLMKRGGWGRIVFVSSSLVRDGKPGHTANLASKAALHGFSRALASELAADGIYSNVVIPELTLSEWVTHAFPPAVLEEYARSFPTGRLGTPDDVANLIAYLGSAANSFVNGEEIRVTGGK
ncbi:SDR family oxidoreductase [Cohnella xylanilytica]|uniref:SDR family oxidoreductase n=1 Tax=Cohnella xylanilytica TaxID=557555 RepID=A0A841TUS3_9BACL|nr:SDR family NAD(P)-dependent oxidoreductase [Cohnella xylanilytica]MBB6690682.1 SDR family oxidoreductase [Cohnella xylanilytica]